MAPLTRAQAKLDAKKLAANNQGAESRDIESHIDSRAERYGTQESTDQEIDEAVRVVEDHRLSDTEKKSEWSQSKTTADLLDERGGAAAEATEGNLGKQANKRTAADDDKYDNAKRQKTCIQEMNQPAESDRVSASARCDTTADQDRGTPIAVCHSDVSTAERQGMKTTFVADGKSHGHDDIAMACLARILKDLNSYLKCSYLMKPMSDDFKSLSASGRALVKAWISKELATLTVDKLALRESLDNDVIDDINVEDARDRAGKACPDVKTGGALQLKKNLEAAQMREQALATQRKMRQNQRVALCNDAKELILEKHLEWPKGLNDEDSRRDATSMPLPQLSNAVDKLIVAAKAVSARIKEVELEMNDAEKAWEKAKSETQDLHTRYRKAKLGEIAERIQQIAQMEEDLRIIQGVKFFRMAPRPEI